MRIPQDWKRRTEVRRAARKLRQLSRQRAVRTRAERQLHSQVRRQVRAQARGGMDDTLLKSVGDTVRSHLVEMKVELMHRHAAQEMKLDKVRARVDGLVSQYTHESKGRTRRFEHLQYQLRAALRGVEDRDTPMPAGPDGEEVAGYQIGNVGELAGQGIWILVVLYVVLVLAQVADLITFRQVAERVVNDTAVLPLVLALTATTTYVAHRAGEAFGRERQLRRTLRRAIGGWALSVVWLAMGIGAFSFRLLAPAPVGSSSVTSFETGDTPFQSSDGSPALSAVLLLLLYLLTGAIAITAGYHRPRVEIAQYVRTNRRLRWVDRRLGYLLRDITEAEALSRGFAELRQARKKQHDAEVARCEAAARRAQADAALLMHRLGNRTGIRFWRRLPRRPAAEPTAGPAAEMSG